MNILISGGTGLLGNALVAALIADGHRTMILTRDLEKAWARLPVGAIPFKWDGRSTEGWGHLIEETDVVINLAGESIAGGSLPAILTHRWTPARLSRISASREDAGHALVAAIQVAVNKPGVFMQASAVGYYGPRGDEDIPESTAEGTDTLAQICRDWEASSEPLETMGIRRVVLRTGLVLAVKGGILPIMLLPFRFFAGGPLGGGKQVVPWIHIEDEINVIRFLLQDGTAHGAYNLAAPNPVQQREFAQIAGRILRRPSFIPTPGFALKLALGEKASLVLTGQKALPQRLIEAGFKFKYETLGSALGDLI